MGTPSPSSDSAVNRFRPVLIIGVAALMLGLAGCTAAANHDSSGSAAVTMGAASVGGGAAEPQSLGAPTQATDAAGQPAKVSTPLQQRDIVRTGTLALKVSDVDRAANAVVAQTQRVGGRVDGDARSNTGDRRTASLVLRLPAQAWDAMITDLVTHIGTETSRTVKGEDVTATRADVTARVAALQTSVGRLTDFLKHSGTINDLVSLEGQLTQREAELESTVAQQRALSDQISLTTLTVELSAPKAVTPVRASGPSGFGSALAGGLHALTVGWRWLMAAVGYALPFGVVAALVIVPLLVIWRRRRLSGPPVEPIAASDAA
jgi:hypothetical protein